MIVKAAHRYPHEAVRFVWEGRTNTISLLNFRSRVTVQRRTGASWVNYRLASVSAIFQANVAYSSDKNHSPSHVLNVGR